MMPEPEPEEEGAGLYKDQLASEGRPNCCPSVDCVGVASGAQEAVLRQEGEGTDYSGWN